MSKKWVCFTVCILILACTLLAAAASNSPPAMGRTNITASATPVGVVNIEPAVMLSFERMNQAPIPAMIRLNSSNVKLHRNIATIKATGSTGVANRKDQAAIMRRTKPVLTANFVNAARMRSWRAL